MKTLLQLTAATLFFGLAAVVVLPGEPPSLNLGFETSLDSSENLIPNANLTESNGTFVVTVRWPENLPIPSSGTYATTSDGTATSGKDFLATTGTLQFSADSGIASFELRILDDDAAEGFETIGLRLSAGGIVSGGKLLLLDNDRAFQVDRTSGPGDIELTKVGSWPGYGRGGTSDLAISGTLGFLAAHGGGLHVYELSDPAKPRLRGTVGGFTGHRVAVSGNYAYVMDYWGMHIIDISDPDHPRRLGNFHSGHTRIKVEGNTAYMTSGGFEVFDLSDPIRPRSLGRLSRQEEAMDLGETDEVILRGSTAYLSYLGKFRGSGIWEGGGVEILDVSDPANMRRLGRYSTQGTPRAIALSGDYLYLLHGGTNSWELGGQMVGGTLEVLDVSQPESSRQVAALAVSGARMLLDNGYAYICDHYGGLKIVDVRDPRTPKLVGTMAGISSVMGKLDNTLVGFAGGGELVTLDLTYPESPKHKSSTALYASTRTIATHGNHAFVGGTDGLSVLDLSNPARPKKVGGLDSMKYTGAIVVREQLLYTLSGNGLGILDIQVPSAPRQIGNLNNAGGHALDVAGTIAVVGSPGYWTPAGNADGEIITVDVSTPANPRVLAKLPVRGGVQSVVVSGGLAVASGYFDGGVQIFDISDPTKLKKISEVAGVFGGIALSGGYLYAGNRIIDISDPATPRIVSNSHVGSDSGSVVLQGRQIWWFGGNALTVGYRQNPGKPEILGRLSFGPYVYFGDSQNSVALSGSHAYLAADIHGVQVIEFKEANPPRFSEVDLGTAPDPFPDPWGMWTPPSPLASSGNLMIASSNGSLSVRAGGLRQSHLASVVQVIDVTDPVLPRKVGRIDLTVPITATALSDKLILVCLGNDPAISSPQLAVFELNGSTQPRLVGSLDLPATASRAVVIGHIAYLALHEKLLAIDLKDVSKPHLLATLPFGSVDQFQPRGSQLYVVGNGNLSEIVWENPSSLRAKPMAIPGSGNIRCVSFSGSLAYLTIEVGVRVVDLADSTNPKVVGSYDVPEPRNLVVDGALAYVATDSGLVVLDFSDPATPKRVGGNSAIHDPNFVLIGNQLAVPTDSGFTILSPFIPEDAGIRLTALHSADRQALHLDLQSATTKLAVIQTSQDLRTWTNFSEVQLQRVPSRLTVPIHPDTFPRFFRTTVP